MRLPALLLLPFALAAQSPPAENLCTLSGTVTNIITSEPVRRAVVAIRRIDASPGTITVRIAHSVSTDAAGKFTITGVDPGTYRVSAERTGFIRAQYGARGPNKPGIALELTTGQKSTGLTIALYPHGVISGRVLDEEGEAVPNAEVLALHLQYIQGRQQLTRSGAATTNDLGEYRIFGLAPGRYYLNANYHQDPVAIDSATAAGAGTYAATFYPRTVDPAAAAPLDLTAGAQLRNADISLARVHTVNVKGRVISEVGGQGTTSENPARNNLNVVLAPNNPLGVGGGTGRGAQIAVDGSFEFHDVVPGNYLLVAMASVPGKAYTARMPLSVGGANIEGLSIVIHAPITLSGQVTIDGESSENLTKIRIGLQPWETSAGVFGPLPDVPLRPDGSFQVPDLSAEHYRVIFYALPEGFYVKSVRASNVDVQLAGVDLGGGAPVALTVVLSPHAASLSGIAVDPRSQKPVAAVTVVAVPQEKERRERESFYRTSATDQAGHFSFKNLIPGDYKIFCWEDVPYGSWMDPEFMAVHDSHADLITVRESSAQSIQVNLIADQ